MTRVVRKSPHLLLKNRLILPHWNRSQSVELLRYACTQGGTPCPPCLFYLCRLCFGTGDLPHNLPYIALRCISWKGMGDRVSRHVCMFGVKRSRNSLGNQKMSAWTDADKIHIVVQGWVNPCFEPWREWFSHDTSHISFFQTSWTQNVLGTIKEFWWNNDVFNPIIIVGACSFN